MKSRFMMLATTIVALAITGPAGAVPAANDTSVLVLGPTVDGGLASHEAIQAASEGFTVEVVDAATWGAMSQADFGTYRAIILGDPDCASTTTPLAAAEASKATWGPAIDGNIVIIGTDPTFHSGAPGSGSAKPGALELARAGIDYARDLDNRTGAYITLSCYYASDVAAPVPVLDPFGSFTVTGEHEDDVTIVAAGHPVLAALSDTLLSDWGNSTHEVFNSFDSSFDVLVTEDSTTLPYIIARDGDPFVVVVEPDPDGGNVDVFPDDPASPVPITLTLQKVVTGGIIELSCCAVDAFRESLGNGKGINKYYRPGKYDVGEQVAITEGCEALRPVDGEGGIGVGEFLISKDTRVLPDPALTSDALDDLYTGKMVADKAARAGLQWAVCLLDTGNTVIDGISFFEEDASKVIPYEVRCGSDQPGGTSDLPADFRGHTVAVNMDPTDLNSPNAEWMTGECDRSRSGRKTSRIGFAMNARYDSTQNPVHAAVNRAFSDLEDEIAAEQATEAGESSPDFGYIDQLSDLAAALADARKAVHKARKNVKKGELPSNAFDPAITKLDEFTCDTFDLPQRDRNAKGLFGGRGMSLKWGVCTYERHPDGILKPDCSINAGIEDTISDPDYAGACPVL